MNQQESWPSWKQVLVLIFGGIILAASFCAGFVHSGGIVIGPGLGTVFSYILAGGFFLSLAMFLSGIVALVIRVVREIFRR